MNLRLSSPSLFTHIDVDIDIDMGTGTGTQEHGPTDETVQSIATRPMFDPEIEFFLFLFLFLFSFSPLAVQLN